jgi:peptidoglycan/LPS O-acetylase OafA/YrhL
MRERLTPLDGLRGLAAVGVACGYHYRFFGGPITEFPLHWLLPMRWLYHYGWLCVDLFFVLSGLVFMFRYREALAARRVGAWNFFLYRVSRLYPLHLATLLVASAIQWTWLSRGASPFVFADNDWYHFGLNLVFMQAGWFEDGFSYNGPSWSIAVEIFLYAVFYVVAVTAVRTRHFALTAAVLVGLGAYLSALQLDAPLVNWWIARGVAGFFAGALTLLLIQWLVHLRKARLLGWIAVALMASIVVLRAHFAVGGLYGVNAHALLLFPLLIAASLTWRPLSRLLSSRPLTFLGDISYSVYMIHFPVALVFLSTARILGADLPVRSLALWMAYAVTVLGVAVLSYRYFELPAQRWLRARYEHRDGATAPASPGNARRLRPAEHRGSLLTDG